MNFDYSDRVLELSARISTFMDEHVYANESVYHEQVKIHGWKQVPPTTHAHTHAHPHHCRHSRQWPPAHAVTTAMAANTPATWRTHTWGWGGWGAPGVGGTHANATFLRTVLLLVD